MLCHCISADFIYALCEKGTILQLRGAHFRTFQKLNCAFKLDNET